MHMHAAGEAEIGPTPVLETQRVPGGTASDAVERTDQRPRCACDRVSTLSACACAAESIDVLRSELQRLFRGLAVFDRMDVEGGHVEMVLRICERMGHLASRITESILSEEDRALAAQGIVRHRELRYVEERGELRLAALSLAVRDAELSVQYYKYVLLRHRSPHIFGIAAPPPMYVAVTPTPIDDAGGPRAETSQLHLEVSTVSDPSSEVPPPTLATPARAEQGVSDAPDSAAQHGGDLQPRAEAVDNRPERAPLLEFVTPSIPADAPVETLRRDRRKEARSGDFLVVKLPPPNAVSPPMRRGFVALAKALIERLRQ